MPDYLFKNMLDFDAAFSVKGSLARRALVATAGLVGVVRFFWERELTTCPYRPFPGRFLKNVKP